MLRAIRTTPLLLLGLSVGFSNAAERRSEPNLKRPSVIRQTSFGPELRQAGIEPAAPRLAVRTPAPLLLPTILAGEGEPTPPPPAPVAAPEPAPAALPTPGVGENFQPITPVPMEGTSVSILYPHVRYKDLDNVPKCAVPMIVAVPHPCKKCCYTYVQICVPPNCRPKVVCKHHGHELEYQFGSYEVEIKTRSDGTIEIDYDD